MAQGFSVGKAMLSIPHPAQLPHYISATRQPWNLSGPEVFDAVAVLSLSQLDGVLARMKRLSALLNTSEESDNYG
jgi:hypothetical protein